MDSADVLVIPRGGFSQDAEMGITALATEICDFVSNFEHNFSEVAIILPAGTGTSAFYLSKALHNCKKKDFMYNVYAVPVTTSIDQMKLDLSALGIENAQ